MSKTDFILESEAYREAIQRIRSQPISLEFGIYRLEISDDGSKYFMHKWVEKEVPALLSYDGGSIDRPLRVGDIFYDQVNGINVIYLGEGSWEPIYPVPDLVARNSSYELPDMIKQRFFLEVEVEREEWLRDR